MLPVQNRRLFFHQIKLFSNDEDIVISLPEGYSLTDFDSAEFTTNKISVIYVPKQLSLGESVIYSLNVLAKFDKPIKILHGDTLINNVPLGLDLCSIAHVEDDYSWNYYKGIDGSYAYTGYFAFKSQPLLIRSIIEQNYNFIEGVRSYGSIKELNYVEVERWLDFGMINSYYRSKITNDFTACI